MIRDFPPSFSEPMWMIIAFRADRDT